MNKKELEIYGLKRISISRDETLMNASVKWVFGTDIPLSVFKMVDTVNNEIYWKKREYNGVERIYMAIVNKRYSGNIGYWVVDIYNDMVVRVKPKKEHTFLREVRE